MVLGTTRARPRLMGRQVFSLVPTLQERPINSEWLSLRGTTVYQSTVNIHGSFPGFSYQGFALRKTQLHITDNYLLVDEDETHGFGLPLLALNGATVIARPGRERPALRVFYRAGGVTRHFTIHFQSRLRSLLRENQAEETRKTLLDLGVPDRIEDHDPTAPDISVPWGDARRYEQENVIWRGKATAPVLLGEDLAPADVWLTTRSVIWSAIDGDGINRLGLDAVSDVITGHISGPSATPTIYLAYTDTVAGPVRFDIPFVFDQYETERNRRERGAFLVGLRSRGVPLGSPVPPMQPWRMNIYQLRMDSRILNPIAPISSEHQSAADEQEASETIEIVAVGDDLQAETSDVFLESAEVPDVLNGEFEELNDQQQLPRNLHFALNDMEADVVDDSTDIVLAEFSVADCEDSTTSVSRNQLKTIDIALSSEWSETTKQLSVGVVAQSTDEPDTPQMVVVEQEPRPCLDAVRALESANLSLLSEALMAIRDRAAGQDARPLTAIVPAQSMTGAANAELNEAVRDGHMTSEEAATRKVRLSAISEAACRLRSLIELRDAGHLTDEDLAAKRMGISQELSGLILAGADLSVKSGKR